MTKPLPNEMSIDLLHTLFVCDFERGIISHKTSRQGIRNMQNAGFVHPDGYRRIVYAKKSFAAHRVVWAMYYGAWPSGILDHIDGNRSNNAISNLRIVDASGNAANRRARKGTTSAFKGVAWNKSCKKWQAQIRKGNENFYLGLFEREEDAHAAYAAKAKELFGEFARAA